MGHASHQDKSRIPIIVARPARIHVAPAAEISLARENSVLITMTGSGNEVPSYLLGLVISC